MPKEDHDVEAEAATTEKIITKRNYTTLLKKEAQCQKDIDSAVGEKRELIANAVEKHHLNKGAHALHKTLAKMPIGKRARVWRHLLVLMDHSGMMEEIDGVQELDLGDGEIEAGEEGASEESETSARVVRPRFAAEPVT